MMFITYENIDMIVEFLKIGFRKMGKEVGSTYAYTGKTVNVDLKEIDTFTILRDRERITIYTDYINIWIIEGVGIEIQFYLANKKVAEISIGQEKIENMRFTPEFSPIKFEIILSDGIAYLQI